MRPLEPFKVPERPVPWSPDVGVVEPLDLDAPSGFDPRTGAVDFRVTGKRSPPEGCRNLSRSGRLGPSVGAHLGGADGRQTHRWPPVGTVTSAWA